MKVEQVVILPEDVALSDELHDHILGNSMEILNDFKIPYRVLQLCS
jgi:seryl-tRNA synthetase